MFRRILHLLRMKEKSPETVSISPTSDKPSATPKAPDDSFPAVSSALYSTSASVIAPVVTSSSMSGGLYGSSEARTIDQSQKFITASEVPITSPDLLIAPLSTTQTLHAPILAVEASDAPIAPDEAAAVVPRAALASAATTSIKPEAKAFFKGARAPLPASHSSSSDHAPPPVLPGSHTTLT